MPTAGTSALVEEAVTVGDLVRLFTFRKSNSNLVELTIPEDSPLIGRSLTDVTWPDDVVPVAILRGNTIRTPDRASALEAGDELVLGQTVDTNSAWISAALAAPNSSEERTKVTQTERKQMPTPELEVPARYYLKMAEVLTRRGVDVEVVGDDRRVAPVDACVRHDPRAPVQRQRLHPGAQLAL